MVEEQQDASWLTQEGESLANQFRWMEAATLFRQAARLRHAEKNHEAEALALRRAAQCYEALQPWRNAGQAWLDAAEAFAGHPHHAGSLQRKSEAGEAYLWAGYTFWWGGQDYDSFRAHFVAGDEFKKVGDLQRAERAYRFAAVSKARAFATTSRINREVHPFFLPFSERDPLDDLAEVAELRQETDDPEGREFAARTHIDTLFAIRRALEEAGNQEEASRVYQVEMRLRCQHARQYGPRRRWLWLSGFGLVTGYGESFLRLAAWAALFFLVLFPLIYAAPGTKLIGADNLLDDIYFSLVTATTVGYGDLQPTGVLKIVANAESLVGLLGFGLVVSIIVHRISRAN